MIGNPRLVLHPPCEDAPDATRESGLVSLTTVGLLRRRPVTGITLDYVGKESNRLEEVQTGLVHDPEEVLTVIPDPRRGAWPKLVLPVLRDCPLSYLARHSKRSASTLKRIRAGATRPGPDLATDLIRAAAQFARRRLKMWNVSALSGDLAVCYAYLVHRKLWRK